MLLLVPCAVQDYAPEELRQSWKGFLYESGGNGAKGTDCAGWQYFGTWGLEAIMACKWSETPEGRAQWAVKH